MQPSKPTLFILTTAPPEVDEKPRSQEEVFSNEYERPLYQKQFKDFISSLGYTPNLLPLGFKNYKKVIDEQIGDPKKHELILNLCDGAEIDGYIGISVSKYLLEKGYEYVGARPTFTVNTTSKLVMKDCFTKKGVPSAKYVPITSWRDTIEKEIKDKGMKYPLFVKVGNSYGATGLSADSKTEDFSKVQSQVKKILEQYGEVLLEEFIAGPEFSCLVYEDEGEVKAYMPAKRVFDTKDQSNAFLTYEMEWKTWKSSYNFVPIEKELGEKIMEIAKKAFKAVNGNEFGRVDFRMRESTGELFVLEVNDTCGLGYGTTSEFILKCYGENTENFLKILIKNLKNRMEKKK